MTRFASFSTLELQFRAKAELERRKRAAATSAENADADLLPPKEWAEAYRQIEARPFSLSNYRPLWEPYNDDHPNQVYLKCAQIGASEMMITKAVHALDQGARYYGATEKAGLNVAYLFPTKDALEDFSKERLSVIKHESPYLETLFASEYDAIDYKQIGFSNLYLRGTHSKTGLKSFPADILIYDEFDEMDHRGISLAEARLRASPLKFQWRISTPMFPGKGVHALYLESDQRVWEVPCPACGFWQELDFFRDVRVAGAAYQEWQTWRREQIEQLGPAAFTVACLCCGGTLDRFAAGRWTAKQPAVTWLRGYHLPALAFPSVNLRRLCVKALSNDPAVIEEFWRSDLGLPYDAAGSRITDQMLAQLSHQLDGGKLPSATWRQTTMGVDVGSRWYYRITSTGPGGLRYVRAMGTAASWEELSTLMTTYKVRRCILDGAYEAHGGRAWAIKHKGKVLRANYPAEMKGELYRLVPAEKNEDKQEIAGTERIQINRTMAMDAVYALIAGGEDECWPAEIVNNPEIAEHLKAPVRVTTMSKDGQPRTQWIHTKPDDFFHASLYDRLAFLTLPKSDLSGLGIIQGAATGWQP